MSVRPFSLRHFAARAAFPVVVAGVMGGAALAGAAIAAAEADSSDEVATVYAPTTTDATVQHPFNIQGLWDKGSFYPHSAATGGYVGK